MNMRQFGRIATGGVISLSMLRLKKIACDDGKTAPQQGMKTAPPQGITRGSLGIAPVATWDSDWDCREGRERSNVTRHLILVRHGQYVEGGKEDASQVLTELGRRQAELTGKRLAAYLPEGACWKAMHQSDMIRAKETAAIIASHLPQVVPLNAPNPLLNEGYPAEPVPTPRSMWKREDTWKDAPRIEAAFRSLFYRAVKTKEDAPRGDPLVHAPAINTHQPPAATGATSGELRATAAATPATPATHEYELVVCHGNVIRYFLCRALQMPPELWLRWCIFNCGITHICVTPAGSCSVVAVGDVGHLDNADALSYGNYYGYSMTRKQPQSRL